jgi:SAM-dependent methyltransferase
MMDQPEDPWGQLDYRRLIDWPKRLEREWRFLEPILATAPSRRLLDLGCGTGEHARFFAERGFEVVGVDQSEAMLEKARESVRHPAVTFVQGELQRIESVVSGPFGAAFCLGNTLPHLPDTGALDGFFRGLRSLLVESAPFVLQLLNYEKIFAARQRALPLSFFPEGHGEIVFLRLLDPLPDGTVIFTPATLKYDPASESPLELLASRRVLHRGWRREELTPALTASGFGAEAIHGTVGAVPYVPTESTDLVIVAR